MNIFTIANAVTLLLYVVIIAAVVVGFSWAANWAETTYQSEAAFEDWQDWRDEAKQQADGKGPVKRRVPKSAAPPALVLAQEHYYSFLIISVVLTTALFATSAFLVRGVFLSPSDPPSKTQ
ncbi:MAG: hypothetical protein NXI22_21135 [bacterium]|nr:hypothetical protein [bacterium]